MEKENVRPSSASMTDTHGDMLARQERMAELKREIVFHTDALALFDSNTEAAQGHQLQRELLRSELSRLRNEGGGSGITSDLELPIRSLEPKKGPAVDARYDAHSPEEEQRRQIAEGLRASPSDLPAREAIERAWDLYWNKSAKDFDPTAEEMFAAGWKAALSRMRRMETGITDDDRLRLRDEFIVNEGLWEKFCKFLPAPDSAPK